VESVQEYFDQFKWKIMLCRSFNRTANKNEVLKQNNATLFSESCNLRVSDFNLLLPTHFRKEKIQMRH
jgi:hypothetical protein